MVEKINGLNPLSQTFSTNGMKLSQLKESNELLFKFFKSNGYKEDQIIYSTDIDKVIEQYDTNNDDKLSQKELKKMFTPEDGSRVSRKERRAAREALLGVLQNDLSQSSELLPETIDDKTINYKDAHGTLIYTHTNDPEEGDKKTYFINGNPNKIDKVVVSDDTDGGKLTTTTRYLDGDTTRIAQTINDDAGDVTTTDYNWDADNLVSTTSRHGNDVTFTKYKNIGDERVETLVMHQFASDTQSYDSTENEYNEDGLITSQTMEFNGAKIDPKTRVTKQVVTLKEPLHPMVDITPENIQEVQLTVINDENKEEIQYRKNIGEKLQRVEKDDKGNSFVTIKCPKGWTIKQLANSFGISEEELLAANKGSDGDALWHTNSQGVKYFLIDDKVRIMNPAKIPDELSEDAYLWGKDAELPEVKRHSVIDTGAVNPSKRKTGEIPLKAPTVPEGAQLIPNGTGEYTATVTGSDGIIRTYTVASDRTTVTAVDSIQQRERRQPKRTEYKYGTDGLCDSATVYSGDNVVKTVKYKYEQPRSSNRLDILISSIETYTNGKTVVTDWGMKNQRTGRQMKRKEVITDSRGTTTTIEYSPVTGKQYRSTSRYIGEGGRPCEILEYYDLAGQKRYSSVSFGRNKSQVDNTFYNPDGTIMSTPPADTQRFLRDIRNRNSQVNSTNPA